LKVLVKMIPEKQGVFCTGWKACATSFVAS
jgi:hypothetical protein